MKAILIPVKEFRRSKERLAPHYSEEERATLARALCEDTFEVVAQVRDIDRVYVVSGEGHALDLARRRDWRAIAEREQISESASVDAASRHCAAEGIQALLRLPFDIPLVTAGDIEALFAVLEPAPSVVIVPSGDGTGTKPGTPPAIRQRTGAISRDATKRTSSAQPGSRRASPISRMPFASTRGTRAPMPRWRRRTICSASSGCCRPRRCSSARAWQRWRRWRSTTGWQRRMP